MAEGMFRKAIVAAGLDRHVVADSAGTHAYHVGSSPDPRAQQAISPARRGYQPVARTQGGGRGFRAFDYILVMDGDNYSKLIERAPAQHHGKIRRLLSFSRKYPNLDVVDPYYGGPQGFEENLDMIEDAVQGLIREITGDTKVRMRSGS